MASQSLFLTKLSNERRFRSFLVAAAKNCTPRTRCSLCLNFGVSSSDSTVFVVFSTATTSPYVIISMLASSCAVVPIVGGSTLCVCSSCMQIFGSTRLTQISAVSSLLSDVVCVAVVVFCGSVCVTCVAFVVSICLGLTVVGPDVLVSVKMILEKVNFFVVSVFFFADSISLAARAVVVVDSIIVSCGNEFVMSVFPFFPFVGGVTCAILGPKSSPQMSLASSVLTLLGPATRLLLVPMG